MAVRIFYDEPIIDVLITYDVPTIVIKVITRLRVTNES